MQIQEVTYGSSLEGVAHYFSAVLFEGWGFWTSGPSHHIGDEVLVALSQYQNVERAVIVKVYVPRIN